MKPQSSNQRRAELLLFSVTIVWGSTFVITKGLLEANSPYFYCGFRFLLSALIVFVPFYRKCISIPRDTIKDGSILGMLLFVGFVLQTIGIQYTTASKAAFFTGMLVPLTPIVHYIGQQFFKLKKRAVTVGNVVGVISAAVGLFFLTSPAGSGFNIGDAMNLACSLFFAIFIVYLDTVPAESDKLQLTFVQFLSCGIAGFLFAMFFEDIRVGYDTHTIAGFLYLTIFATVITMWIQNRFQGDTTPTRAAVIFAMEPVVAAVFAYFVLSEMIGMLGVLGGIIIIAGLLLSEFSDSIPFLRKRVSEG